MINAMYRVCDNGPMFDTRDEADAYMRNNVGGVVWIDAMAWCDDCADWVEEGRMEHCPDCGAKWYDEEGKQGFRGGMGRKAWNMHKANAARRASEQAAQVAHDLANLQAWNAGLASK